MINVESAIRLNYPGLFNYPAFVTHPLLALLRALFREREINAFLAGHQEGGLSFIDAVLDHLDISYSADQKELEHIPAIGKVIVVANHPMGAMDAFALIRLVSHVRQNRKVRILANPLLMQIPQLAELLIPIDNMTGKLSRRSVRMVEEALEQDEAELEFLAAGFKLTISHHAVVQTGFDGQQEEFWYRVEFPFTVANFAAMPLDKAMPIIERAGEFTSGATQGLIQIHKNKFAVNPDEYQALNGDDFNQLPPPDLDDDPPW